MHSSIVYKDTEFKGHAVASSNVPAGTAGVYLSLEFENRDQSDLLIDLFGKQNINFKIV